MPTRWKHVRGKREASSGSAAAKASEYRSSRYGWMASTCGRARCGASSGAWQGAMAGAVARAVARRCGRGCGRGCGRKLW